MLNVAILFVLPFFKSVNNESIQIFINQQFTLFFKRSRAQLFDLQNDKPIPSKIYV
jgi:hypothetical protein